MGDACCQLDPTQEWNVNTSEEESELHLLPAHQHRDASRLGQLLGNGVCS